MNRIRLIVEGNKSEEISFPVKKMINAGYTGRNQEAVRKHVEELIREGIPAPESTPTAYEVITKLLSFDEEIEVIGDKTSGEAEYVLLCSGKNIYVGVGSDHTDRELEAVSIIKSKQICPNILSKRAWNYGDVEKHWDELILRSWVEEEGGQRLLYQEAPLGVMMSPPDLMEFIKTKMGDRSLEGVLIYSGTIPILAGKTSFSSYFETELYNPVSGKSLRAAYHVKKLDYLRMVHRI
jgi:hypothetical protein